MRSEREHQVLVMQWAKLNQRRLPGLELLFAVPNGGDRNRIVAARMKAEGVRSGVPDLALPVPRGGYAALFIEMKRKRIRRRKTMPPKIEKTEPTDEQLRWIAALREAGNAVEVCHSAEEAQAVIERYLTGDYTPSES